MVTQFVQYLNARLFLYSELVCKSKVQRNRRHLVSLTFVPTYLTHPVNTEHCEAQYNAESLIVIALSECSVDTIQKLCFWEMSERKFINKYVFIMIFWNFLGSTECNYILLFVYSLHLYGLLVFNNFLLRI